MNVTTKSQNKDCYEVSASAVKEELNVSSMEHKITEKGKHILLGETPEGIQRMVSIKTDTHSIEEVLKNPAFYRCVSSDNKVFFIMSVKGRIKCTAASDGFAI